MRTMLKKEINNAKEKNNSIYAGRGYDDSVWKHIASVCVGGTAK